MYTQHTCAGERSDTVVDAAEQGKVDVVRYLCELPQGEPDAVSPRAMDAALLSAARNGHSNVVRYLCELYHRASLTL